MPNVLVVADAAWVLNEVRAALSEPGTTITEESDPQAVTATAAGGDFDAAVIDLQVGSMGGMAIARALKDDAHARGTPPLPMVLLLDRRADAFLAKRAAADAWVQKPFTPFELRRGLQEATKAGDGNG